MIELDQVARLFTLFGREDLREFRRDAAENLGLLRIEDGHGHATNSMH